MDQILRFDQIAGQKRLVFLRLPPGTALQPGEQSMLMQLTEGSWRQRAFPPWDAAAIGDDGVWYAVNFSRISLQIGFSDLISYVIPAIRGQVFRLGFHADVNVRVASVHGLYPHMQTRDSMTMLELLHTFKSSMHDCVVQALETVLGPDVPTLDQVIGNKGQIEKETESALFWLLYQNGLCIKPHSFAISGFAPPLLQ